MEKNEITKLGTYNLQGKLGMMGQSTMLFKDMIRRKLDICAFQETMIQEDREFNEEKKGTIINLAGPEPTNGKRRYGMGFFISNKWKHKLEGVRSISERIAVIKFAMNDERTKILSIINIYGPTMMRADQDENELRKFYGELQQTYNLEKKKADGNLPRIIDRDIQQVPKNKKLVTFGITELKNKEQLNKLKTTAQDREKWKKIVQVVEENSAKIWKEREYKRLRNKDKDEEKDEEYYEELMNELNRLI